MLKKIAVSELTPGMYVNGVTKQQGTFKIKNQGLVRTKAAIEKLIKAGILEVEIDTEKALAKPEKKIKDTSKKNAAPSLYDPTAITAEFNDEINKAEKLYTEAKSLQHLAFESIKANRKIEIGPFEDVAQGFIDSIFRNQDALACMTRIREKDAYLLEHSINVSVLMTIFAKHLHLEPEVIHQLATGALLHDIGKIKIQDEVLNKPGKFTEDEFNLMKNHALYSKEILEEAGLSGLAVDIAAYHHERLDGKGYPFALSADQIPQHVRMIAIVDVYDALTAKRVYKDGMNPIQAFKIIKDDSPASFDTELVNQFIKCIGIYPIGTLVKLKSQKLGIVTRSNFQNPLQPWVKVFYNAKHQHHTEVKDLNLADKYVEDELESAIKPEDFGIDLMKFFRNSILH